MGVRARLRRFFVPATDQAHAPPAARGDRRKVARERAKLTDGPHWTEADRMPRTTRREVDDTGGLGMGMGGGRTIDDR
jgi:hypothetical protein